METSAPIQGQPSQSRTGSSTVRQDSPPADPETEAQTSSTSEGNTLLTGIRRLILEKFDVITDRSIIQTLFPEPGTAQPSPGVIPRVQTEGDYLKTFLKANRADSGLGTCCYQDQPEDGREGQGEHESRQCEEIL